MKRFYGIICTTIIALLSFTLSSSLGATTTTQSNTTDLTKTFSILSVTPQGELLSSIKYPAIQIQFSEPVIPLKQLGKKSNTSDIVSITPKLNGTFRWHGTSILSFESDDEVIPQKKYTITVNKNTKSIKGSSLQGNLSFSFYTEELKITRIQPGYSEAQQNKYVNSNSVPTKLAEDIAVYFNFPVNVNVIKKHLLVTYDSKEISFEATQEDKSIVRLTLQESIPEDTDVKVILQKGAMADEDCIQTSVQQSKSFHTLVPFAITSCSSSPNIYYTDTEHKNSITLRFTEPLALGSEQEAYKYFTTSLNSIIKKENIKITNQSLIIYDVPDASDTTYNLFVAKELCDVYGRKLNKDYSFTIKVPKKQSFAQFQNEGNVIIESSKNPELSFIHQNIKAGSKYTVTPIDSNGLKKDCAKTFVLDPTKILQDTIIKEQIDLRPFLKESSGSYYGSVMFSADINTEYQYTDWKTKEIITNPNTIKNEQIIQLTNLSVTIRYSYNKIIVLVSKTNTGEVVSNATVTAYLIPNKTKLCDRLYKDFTPLLTATTSSDGIAELVFGKNQFKNLPQDCTLYIEAKTQNDKVLYSPESNYFYEWYRSRDSFAQTPKMVAFLFTDRGLYKPGEEVSFNIIDRTLLEGEYYTPSKEDANYTIKLQSSSWNDKNVYHTQKGTLNQNGSSSGTFTLPQDLKPGTYKLSYSRQVNDTMQTESIQIQVQFFEKLRFEASSSIIDATYYKGDSISATVQAQYLGGGSLSGSDCNVTWTSSSTTFVPQTKELKDYSFGPLQNDFITNRLSYNKTNIDANGKATVSQVAEENFFAKPKIYRMEATVTDSGNQAISTSSQVIVHPSQFYIGINRDTKKQSFAKKGEPITFSYVTITPQEKSVNEIYLPKDKKVTMKLVRENWKEEQTISDYGVAETCYKKELITEEEKTFTLKSSNKGENFSVTPKEAGSYTLSLQTKDSKGNDIVAEQSFYVTSSDYKWFGGNAQEIKLTLDKEEYQVGDTAQILLQSELQKGVYLLTVEREKIISYQEFEIKQPTHIINLPIQKDFVPVVYVSISSYSTRDKLNGNEKPKSYFGTTALNVSTKTKKFDISIQTDKQTYSPGEKAKITLHASYNGKPLNNAQISLMAVDRSILDLINYHVANPIEYFYNKNLFPNGARGSDSRSLLAEQQNYDVVKESYATNDFAAPMLMKTAAGSVRTEYADSLSAQKESSIAMNIRNNFIATAAFEPSLITDKKGNATYTFTLPDSLTSYRITAIGIQDNNFSISEQELQVAEPISVRHVLPKKLRLDDTGEAGVTISNLSSKSQKVTVSVAVYDGIEESGIKQSENELQKLAGSATVCKSATKKINVSANKTVPLMFDIKAKKQGWITVEFTVQSDLVNEKILVPLEIEKPYIYESVTTIGSVITEEDGIEKIILPSNAEDGKGSLYIQLDPTRLGVLKEAVSYVFHYPYGCMEQRSASVLPLVAFGDYIKIFGLNSEVKYPKGVVEQELRTWAKVQCSDGGFPYWQNSNKSNLYVSMRIAEILALAQKNDIPFANIDTKKLASYIAKESNQIIFGKDKSNKNFTSAWSVYIASYASYTSCLLGNNIDKELLYKITESEYADVDSLALCALAYFYSGNQTEANNIANKLKNSCRYTTRGIEIFEKYKNHYWCFFNGEAERYALCLQLFTLLNPNDNINTHIVYELLKMQKVYNGRWQSTALTSRVLIALNEYIKQNKLEQLDFTAEALLDGKKLLAAKFKGVTSQAKEIQIDFDNKQNSNSKLLSSMQKDKELELKFLKQGEGTLYYTASMKYAIPPEKQEALENGLCVFTEILDAETGLVVTGNTLKAGKTYCQKVIISSVINNEYVAVRVPVPAGCEILNSAFVTTGTIPKIENTEQSTNSIWKPYNYNAGLSYTGVYDTEMQYFWDYFVQGSQTVSFYFRAVRKGTYGTPCTTAECMYEEEIFGRSNGKVWVVE